MTGTIACWQRGCAADSDERAKAEVIKTSGTKKRITEDIATAEHLFSKSDTFWVESSRSVLLDQITTVVVERKKDVLFKSSRVCSSAQVRVFI